MKSLLKKSKRMCIVCRNFKNKEDFYKMIQYKNKIYSKEENFHGKGIYICLNSSCIKEFFKKRSFKSYLNILDQEVLNQLQVLTL
ncbi:MAG: DUF448 domain-containing protein [Armatimonadetes bacterium]|nr:DUF448 domain-containing protein [Armatimonadota bacterium]